MNFPNDPKLPVFSVLSPKDSLIVNIPDPLLKVNKLSTGLPLPPLPPPPSHPNVMNRKVSFQTPNEFSSLSVVDLKVVETDLERQKNVINQTLGTEEHPYQTMIIKNHWKDLKFDTEMFKHKDGHKQIEYKWNDYNLNSIDKYWDNNIIKLLFINCHSLLHISSDKEPLQNKELNKYNRIAINNNN